MWTECLFVGHKVPMCVLGGSPAAEGGRKSNEWEGGHGGRGGAEAEGNGGGGGRRWHGDEGRRICVSQ